VDFPKVTAVGEGAFNQVSSQNASYIALQKVNLPVAKTLGNQAFYQCRSMQEIVIPAVTSIGDECFRDCTGLTTVELPAVTTIGKNAFFGCADLTTIIIRNATGACALSNKEAFNNMPVASGTGFIYVPKALLNDYVTGTNWSAHAAQIRAIEDYPEICGGE
jgi:hypothetical protein